MSFSYNEILMKVWYLCCHDSNSNLYYTQHLIPNDARSLFTINNLGKWSIIKYLIYFTAQHQGVYLIQCCLHCLFFLIYIGFILLCILTGQMRTRREVLACWLFTWFRTIIFTVSHCMIESRTHTHTVATPRCNS